MPDPDATYDADETRDLLGRAARLQQAQAPDASPGLTLDEVQEAAAAAGIDPEYVVAAATLDRPAIPGFLGAPATYDVALTLEGRVPPEVFPELRQRIRRAMGHDFDDAPRVPGHGGAGREGFTWDHGTLDHIAFQPTDDGRTAVTARGRWEMIRALTVGGFVVAGLVVGGTVGALIGVSGFVGYGITAVGVGLGVLAGRRVWSRWARRARTRLDAAVKAAVSHAAAHLVPRAAAPVAAPVADPAPPVTPPVTLPDAAERDPEAPRPTGRERSGS